MKKQKKRNVFTALGVLAVFMLWTAAITLIDVQAIGPQNSTVGFATLNRFFHNLTGVHMSLYTITDWLGLVPLSFMFGFALLGLSQWLKRKSLLKVDCSILILGGFYVVVMAVYVFFELHVINYRPVLIEGVLEASYPSSTTMLVMCVMPTAMMQFHTRIKNHTRRRCVNCLITAFIVLMVTLRLISGVHWVTDVIGGILLSAGLTMMYGSIIDFEWMNKI
ncbi:MAG: phosphatase PAP2 family protein [Oscillibacter sp.]|nr:phosphatase PAP2 family protein [Oscillibacter sp.]